LLKGTKQARGLGDEVPTFLDPALYATGPKLALLVPDDKRAFNHVSDGWDERGVANLDPSSTVGKCSRKNFDEFS